MQPVFMLVSVFAIPALLAPVSLLIKKPGKALWFGFFATLIWAAVIASVLVQFCICDETFADGWLILDSLSAYHLAITAVRCILSSLSAIFFFYNEPGATEPGNKMARNFTALYLAALSAMSLTLISNNIGISWVGIEATTLLTAFLILSPGVPASIEAMWKYLLMCSVGVALAFAGILIIAASTGAAQLDGASAFNWSILNKHAHLLDPRLCKIAFVFLFVGFGTKSGIAPMHSWVPDAYSQAPAPAVIFSGFMINAAFYCLLRYLPIIETATGNVDWAREILVIFGMLSILIGAVFVITQNDVKRLLAYLGIEHMGVIALGIGIGGMGVLAGLLLIFTHSICKTISFLSVGRLGQIYGTHDLRKMTGVFEISPV
ncbi:MAG: hypothetical protein GX811_11060, partial [Lentisphaerae bacterium]|nr:hypothetical protein [Lentisphaerota bacterium]